MAQRPNLVESRSIGAETPIGVFTHILPGASIGRDCAIGDFVSVGDQVVIGDHVVVGDGVSLRGIMEIGDDVTIGPNTTFASGDPVRRESSFSWSPDRRRRDRSRRTYDRARSHRGGRRGRDPQRTAELHRRRQPGAHPGLGGASPVNRRGRIQRAFRSRRNLEPGQGCRGHRAACHFRSPRQTCGW